VEEALGVKQESAGSYSMSFADDCLNTFNRRKISGIREESLADDKLASAAAAGDEPTVRGSTSIERDTDVGGAADVGNTCDGG
jgi:hypothetical protein